ncbi:hypothetical protein N7530_010309 [Penicillium desertorum]|uniref:Uncharacterized protein n=1 Tax=Penicillium desertorum TaxID=1303715 RepID=A0A9W9WH68_9EURO|nr:hypothetical protein N7530_011434 [Penicillium desertorum]KAJ5466522.1 hypothetical protein N7530_010309 [Penicillium desertorum]
MARFLQSVIDYLKSSNGLDMLEGFTLTAFKDPLFDSTTTAILRTYFRNRLGGARVYLKVGPGYYNVNREPEVNKDSNKVVDLDKELEPLEGYM